MDNEKKESCLNCKFFTAGLSENGYCKLYHHNLSAPGRICSKYEENDTTIKSKGVSDSQSLNVKIDETDGYEKTLSYIIGLISFFIIVIAVLFCNIIFFSDIFSNPIPLPVQIATVAVVAAAYLIFLWHTLMLLKKYKFMFIIYLIIALFLILAAILNYGKLWISLSDFDKMIIDYIFFNLNK